jgi:hypothetical protein
MRKRNSIRSGAVWGIILFGLAGLLSCSGGETPYVYQGIYRMVDPTNDYSKRYTDQSIDIQFFIREKRIYFDLRNKTDESILVIWNEALFYDLNGKPQRLVNSRHMFTENVTVLEPTLIPPNTSIRESMVPEDRMVLLEEWTWYLQPLFDFVTVEAKDLKGKTFVLEIPMEVKRFPRVYTFTFEIAQMIVKEKKVTPEIPLQRRRF